MRSIPRILTIIVLIVWVNGQMLAQDDVANFPGWHKKFEQLGALLPSPNNYRTASGNTGRDYWQQRADYVIEVALDDSAQTLQGTETITYYNNSPDTLPYLWLQLDQNIRAKDSDTPLVNTSAMSEVVSGKRLQSISGRTDYEGGFLIKYVKDDKKNNMPYVINHTMMRIDLPKPLLPKGKVRFEVSWRYNINDRMIDHGRSGYEYFPKDKNYVYTIAQFYPRMAVYSNDEGWQNKQFLGNGEFALSFGNFKLSITVPSDHVVAATGVLQNPKQVLTAAQMARLEKAKNSFKKPVLIVTEKEAVANETSRSSSVSAWVYEAENVRDVAFASSRKFIWDAMAVPIGDKKPLAMSYYPKEGNPLWERESTRAVANTLRTYSKYTIPYPYPVAISVHAASIGMEYPMICFNWGRPNEDGSYSDQVKWRAIGVIVHEVGHNFFPMIINSDERQWTWMDEGLNSFLETVAEKENYPDFPLRRGFANSMTRYMGGDKANIRPIMTNSEQILQFGNNAYGKPAAALAILKETVMGEELFNYAFKEYARRWAFKHPTPADFFRTMEDASGTDLDWFWRGWFYSIDHVDISVENVVWYKIMDTQLLPENSNSISDVSINPDPFQNPVGVEVAPTDERFYGEFLDRIDEEKVLETHRDLNFYEVSFKKCGRTGYAYHYRVDVRGWRQGERSYTSRDLEKKRTERV